MPIMINCDKVFYSSVGPSAVKILKTTIALIVLVVSMRVLLATKTTTVLIDLFAQTVVHLATNTTHALTNLDVINSVCLTTKTFDVRMTMAAPKTVCRVHKTSAVPMNLLAPNSVFRYLKVLSVVGLVAPPIVGLTVRTPFKTLFVKHLFENFGADSNVIANSASDVCANGGPDTTTICQKGRTFVLPNH